MIRYTVQYTQHWHLPSPTADSFPVEPPIWSGTQSNILNTNTYHPQQQIASLFSHPYDQVHSPIYSTFTLTIPNSRKLPCWAAHMIRYTVQYTQHSHLTSPTAESFPVELPIWSGTQSNILNRHLPSPTADSFPVEPHIWSGTQSSLLDIHTYNPQQQIGSLLSHPYDQVHNPIYSTLTLTIPNSR